ncbi:hypothetical protein NAEGRDRAFT_80563 [Naegleria gruberi]|uniref:C2 domain-containing protein n=1 Tax=Naegleria gruberi TaxID=5762 RepID=D2VMN4_NAEGR|nr:uncharacterized protein NAEGRDRAFT_80563 [Naegleria gruberi]EFC41764.1 hypothetical protein NAEGRDRAFT_80563 [Naegleria gruberi]|eukprot:XP_002674508.1 hypothetical protein NAEGRDRAFT_80563 [Naegleria gruberi strain NEG-M]
MPNPIKFHSQSESSSTSEQHHHHHLPPQQQQQQQQTLGSSTPIPPPKPAHLSASSTTNSNTTTTTQQLLQANFTVNRTTTTANNNGAKQSTSPTSSSLQHVVGSNNTITNTNNNSSSSGTNGSPSPLSSFQDNGENTPIIHTPTPQPQQHTTTSHSFGFSIIGNRRGSTSQSSGSRNSVKSPITNQFIQHADNTFPITEGNNSLLSSWTCKHKGPVLVVRVSRIEHLNVYPSSAEKANNSSSTTSSNASTPATPQNKQTPTTSNNNNNTSSTTSAVTTSSTTSSSSTSGFVSTNEKFSNYNPHVVVGYGRLKTLKNDSEDAIPIFEQRTKTLQSEVFPIYNTVFEFPLLTMDFSARGKKLSELVKNFPDQLFSSEAHQHADSDAHIEDTTVLSFKVLSHNRYKKKQESVIAVAELNLGDLPHVTNDEKIFLRMRKPGEPLRKSDMINGGEVLPENQPILHLDVKVVWNNEIYKSIGDDESSTSYDKWNDILTQFYIQDMGDDEFDNDPMLARRQEDMFKSMDRLMNQCELLKLVTFPLPHTWHMIGKQDKLILVSPTQLTNEEIFTDNINVYYVYESNTKKVLEEMLKNSEKRSYFGLAMPLHNFKMLSNWQGYRFACYYSLYNKIYHQNVIGIQTKIGVSYILQYVSNCGSFNQPVFDKMLERLTILPSVYSKDLERGKIWCGAVPCAWRGVSKDSIIHLYSPYQCNGKLNCTDQIMLQPFVNNMSTMERIRFILKKYMDDADFEGLEILHGPLATDLNDHTDSVMYEEYNHYSDLEQLESSENVDHTFEPPFWINRRKALPDNLNISKDNLEEASTITFAVKMKAKPPTNTYDVPPPSSFCNSYYIYQKTVVMKMKNVDYQLNISYKTTLNSHLVSEGAFNRLVQSIRLT